MKTAIYIIQESIVLKDVLSKAYTLIIIIKVALPRRPIF